MLAGKSPRKEALPAFYSFPGLPPWANFCRAYGAWQVRAGLAADPDSAEIQYYATAITGEAEIGLGAEAREEHELIELALGGVVAGAGKNFVRDDLAMGVEGGFDEQEAGSGTVVCGDDHRNRKWRQAFEASGLDEIERQVIRNHAAHRNAHENILYEERKYDEGRDNSTGSGNGQRLENIFERHDAARPHMAQHLPRRTSLGGIDANAGGKIRRRLNWLDAREGNDETPVAFEQIPAGIARFDVLTHASVFAGSYRSIQISWQKALGTFAIHLSHPLVGCEPNDAREGSFSG